MAVIEKSSLMKYKDEAGNTYLMYPITNTDNIDGLDEALAENAAVTHTHTKSQISDFPTSMSASDVKAWSKADAKPTYTAAEVGTTTQEYVDSAIQSTIQNTWEASY